MKNLLVTIICSFCCFSVFSQGSLIADLMAVDPVTIEVSDEYKESKEDFEKLLAEQQVKIDELIQKHDEKYTDEVSDLISDYGKVLATGIEQDINNEKRSIATRVNALTIDNRKQKKYVITQFNNKMVQEIRELPKDLRVEKEMEVKTMTDEYLERFTTEYQANQQVIDTFKKTEHLNKTIKE